MTETSLVTQGIGAATVVWIIQELKKAGWFPLIDVDTVKLNRLVSALGALVTGAAINWTWDNNTHVLTISGLTAGAISSFLWNAFQQFVGQEMLYQLIFAPKLAAKEAVVAQVAAQVITTQQAAKKVVEAIADQQPDK